MRRKDVDGRKRSIGSAVWRSPSGRSVARVPIVIEGSPAGLNFDLGSCPRSAILILSLNFPPLPVVHFASILAHLTAEATLYGRGER
jgi:hypothetical protein